MILKISEYQNFLFDCDGVILDSNFIKTKSFEEVLENEKSNHRDQFIEYHLSNTGVSRYDKFDFYLKNIRTSDNYQKEMKDMLLKFSKTIKKNLISCNLTSNVEFILKKLNRLNKYLFIISASDEEELIEICNYRKLNIYFKAILGSPLNKIDNINKLNLSVKDYKKTIFFGDSLSDYKAASHFNFDFVYIKKYSLWQVTEKIKKNPKFQEIEDFSFLEIVP